MPPLSLQTCLVSARPQLSAIPVDPRGFKSALRSLMSFLTTQCIPATLWLKLPKNDAWWTDVWAFGQQVPGCTFYTLGEQTGQPADNLAARLQPIAIEQSDDLKREYLCMAVASNFACVLLAVRMPTGTAPSSDKRNIKLYCSTAGPATAALSIALKEILNCSLETSPETSSEADLAPASEIYDADDLADDLANNLADELSSKETYVVSDADRVIHTVLSQWEQCFPSELLGCESPPLTEAFLTWQLQYQEEMRSQIALYRSSAKQESAAAYARSSDFLSQASQELQSPLTTIKTALTLLGAPTLKMTQRQRYLEMISTQCDRQKSLIISIIDLLKAQTTGNTAPQAIQLANILPGVVSTYQPIAEERGIMLTYTMPIHLTEVLSVESDLRQVVTHLIQNGIQSTPKGGRVWVSATPRTDSAVALTVKDSGAGLSRGEVAKLFDAFYRSPLSREDTIGSRLRLTLVRQLVSRMGGSVSVESAPDQGTTFTILLPTSLTSTTTGPTATGTIAISNTLFAADDTSAANSIHQSNQQHSNDLTSTESRTGRQVLSYGLR